MNELPPRTMKKLKSKSLGLFPLPMVILPSEIVRLHIFESRYKSLVNDCFASGNNFVIPLVVNGKPTQWGTSVTLVDVERFYADGKMDIKIQGVEFVKISALHESGKTLYMTGEVESIDSSIPEIHKKEISVLFERFCMLSETPFTPNRDYSLFEIVQKMKPSDGLKLKLFKNASSSVKQSRVVLNELRILVLTYQLQNESGFRYYMN